MYLGDKNDAPPVLLEARAARTFMGTWIQNYLSGYLPDTHGCNILKLFDSGSIDKKLHVSV